MSLCAPARRATLLSYFWTPIVEQLRFRINLKHPRPLHFERARMKRVCEPQYPPPLRICTKKSEEEARAVRMEDNPYGVFLAKDMRKLFYSHPMVAIFHTNVFIMHETRRIRGLCYDSDFPVVVKWHQNSKVAELALTGTRFEPALRLMQIHFSLMFCETTDLRKLLDIDKKIPDWLLIGVVLDNRLMHRADFEAHANQDMDTVRGQFCNTLTLASGGHLSRNLVTNINALSHSLATYSSSSKDAADSTNDANNETPTAKTET